MIQVVQYRPEHLFLLRPQDHQRDVLDGVSAEHAAALGASPAATVMHGDEVLMCGGVVPIWAGRSMAWAYLSRDVGPHMLSVTRAVLVFLEGHPSPRTEMYVQADFEEAHRWARSLWFHQETVRATRFFPDGTDASVYVRLG